jgi:hypothetical protein
VDGFNLYHALHDLNRPRLKWLSLHALAQKLIPNRSERLVGVVYFSAYASHRAAKNRGQFAPTPSVRARAAGNVCRVRDGSLQDESGDVLHLR